MQRGVAIGGFMGTGKSTVGARLADRLGLPFVDVDRVLEQRWGPIAQQLHDEPTFRARERQVVVELASAARPRVVATGGGAWVDVRNREALRAGHLLVVLKARLATIRERIRAEGRPLWGRAESLYAERELAYRDADLVIDTDDLTVDQVVERILAALPGLAPADRHDVVKVAIPGGGYDVVIDPNGPEGLGALLRARSKATRALVVTDPNVGPLWGPRVEQSLQAAGFATATLEIPAGEQHKTIQTFADLVDRLIRSGVDRKTPIVALGGGVVGDIAGFAAACTLRGLPFVQVPTTVLAMVDSSVGGKTAVDHPLGKNLIGAFHQPILVHASLPTLATLPAREIRAGLAEAVKTALIADGDLLATIEAEADRLRDGHTGALREIIRRCVELKADVVARDERESGVRAVLNLGHTVGHAIEAVEGFGGSLHGEAVGIGLVSEARYAVRAGICIDASLPDRIAALLARIGLPSAVPALDRAAMVDAMRVDKKADGYTVSVPLPVEVGRVTIVPIHVDALHELIA